MNRYGGLGDDLDLAPLAALAAGTGVTDSVSEAVDVSLDFLLRKLHQISPIFISN